MDTTTTNSTGLLTACKQMRAFYQVQIGWAVIGVLTSIVLLVSINDVYWSFKTQDTLLQNERNPLGRWLIHMDGGDIALFMTAKMVGTIVVIMALPLIYRMRRQIGLIVSSALAIFQVLLFVQLNFKMPVLAWI